MCITNITKIEKKINALPAGEAQWSSHPPPEQKIAGSNLARV
jgi:hypothetical protein